MQYVLCGIDVACSMHYYYAAHVVQHVFMMADAESVQRICQGNEWGGAVCRGARGRLPSGMGRRTVRATAAAMGPGAARRGARGARTALGHRRRRCGARGGGEECYQRKVAIVKYTEYI